MAVSWEGHTGLATLYFDGREVAPFWRASGGQVDQQYPDKGRVDKHVAAGTARFDHGAPLDPLHCTGLRETLSRAASTSPWLPLDQCIGQNG